MDQKRKIEIILEILQTMTPDELDDLILFLRHYKRKK